MCVHVIKSSMVSDSKEDQTDAGLLISKKARSIQGPIGADGPIQDSHSLAGPDRALHDLAYN